jgi:SAM-dependent methyltransferase
MPKLRPCPVCKTVGSRRILHRQRFFEGPLGNGYDVVVCGQCGAGFADGIPSQPELDRYYTDRSKYEYTQSGGIESPYDFKRFETIVDQIVPLTPNRKAAILDIGCATGGLLSSFAKRGYTNLRGSDPSAACAVSAQRIHGITVDPSTIENLRYIEKRFDLILLVGVLEHLRDVGLAIQIVSNLLAQGGKLYCAQPDVEAFADCVNAPYQQFSVEHLNFFSTSSLNDLLARHDLLPCQTWRWMIEWREGATDSVMSGLFERSTSANKKRTSIRDITTEPALRQYIDLCSRQDETIKAKIDTFIRSQEPILIWGAGTLTRRLLAATQLTKANIAAFVDASPHLQGRLLSGRRILAPREVAGRTEAIVIASKAFEREIARTVHEELNLPNRVYNLA